MKRGDVFWADLKPRSGAEQQGRQPVIIVSNDGFNLTPGWRSVIGVGGLPRASIALCHQVTTLDRAKLTERAGALPVAVLTAVEGGLRAALDLD
ncbi:MAG: type II toxin-antitoxin system PemK/MazF family toxin [Candidatus Rokubacteria bacterium]|nr:type II toxin-antitoxin system PemK/MazF family toxin [Candidatus Rokubacteria bacterium]